MDENRVGCYLWFPRCNFCHREIEGNEGKGEMKERLFLFHLRRRQEFNLFFCSLTVCSEASTKEKWKISNFACSIWQPKIRREKIWVFLVKGASLLPCTGSSELLQVRSKSEQVGWGRDLPTEVEKGKKRIYDWSKKKRSSSPPQKSKEQQLFSPVYTENRQVSSLWKSIPTFFSVHVIYTIRWTIVNNEKRNSRLLPVYDEERHEKRLNSRDANLCLSQWKKVSPAG